MPAVQTTYGTDYAAGFPGMVANSEAFNSITRICETVAGIGFGVVAARGASDKTCKVSAAAARPLGITIADPGQPGDLYARYANVAILTRGVIFVTCGEDVAQGDPVYFVPGTGALMKTASGNIAIPNAVWDTTTLSGGLAKMRLVS